MTAIAGLITALAGLVVALKNPPADKMSPVMEQTWPPVPAPEAVPQSPVRNQPALGMPIIATEEKTGAPALAVPTAPAQRAISLPSRAEADFPRWTTTMTVISAGLELLNADKRSLRFKVRVSNTGSKFSRVYYWRFRLVVDDLPQAPIAEPRMNRSRRKA